MTYPVLEVLDELKPKLQQRNIVILQAPPGAGKSTVLPLKLLHEPWLQDKKIIMLEPRRLAAKSVAERMAFTLGEAIGKRIGYRVRFESRVSSETKVEVVTEGILTRMLQSDNTLEDVGMLIFDEFHERSLQADLALALSLQTQQVLRDDLRILIMSATLDGNYLSTILDNAPIITSAGKQFPVTIKYTQDSDAPIAVRMAQTIQRACREEEGDVLAFLPGTGEIKRTHEILLDSQVDAFVYPLYGDLSFKNQQDAILPREDKKRKVVLATSIAETSLTIEGIRIVIDSGLSRVPRFDPRSGLTKLETVRVTKDSADQRTGRAGRLSSGVCYRLWSEGSNLSLIPQRKPEILEADLAPLVLELAAWGIKDVKELTWITAPPAGAINQAREILFQLHALDGHGITAKGKSMLRFPTHPRIAHLLLEAVSMQLAALASDVAAILEERDPLPKNAGADVWLRIEALRKYRSGNSVSADRNTLDRIEKLSLQWRKLLKVNADDNMPSETDVGRLLAAAFPERIALQQQKHGERFKLANGRMVKLPDHDALTRETWLAVAVLDAGSGGEGKIFLASPLSPQDIGSLATEQQVVRWDNEREALMSATERRVGVLLLESKTNSKITDEQRVTVLCNVIREKGLRFLGWGEEQIEWQARVMNVATWRKEENWPDVSDENLLSTLETWLGPYLQQVTRRTELERLPLLDILASLLPWELQQQLEAWAPSKIKVPSGSLIKVQYFTDGRTPVMEVRLQEVFGLLETPAINGGRTKIILHLLSPGYKPVQVTQDLKSFWQNTYHEVRKELRSRYPKHHWPEDPWTAEAVRGAKRRQTP